jgi:hypothetical protein
MSDRKPESVGRKPNREEINAMRIKAFLSNLYADQMDYFKACSGWFQDEDYRELERADLHRAEVEALQSQLAEANCALAEWAEVSQRNYQRAIEAEERLAEARDALVEIEGQTRDVTPSHDKALTLIRAIHRHARATLAKIGGEGKG